MFITIRFMALVYPDTPVRKYLIQSHDIEVLRKNFKKAEERGASPTEGVTGASILLPCYHHDTGRQHVFLAEQGVPSCALLGLRASCGESRPKGVDGGRCMKAASSPQV